MALRTKVKTAPTFTPVTLTELKRNLRIEHSDQDELLQDLIDRAVAASQSATGRQYASAVITAYLDEYPVTNIVEIERGPVAEIISVKYLAPGASVLTTLDAAKYQLDNVDLTARLRFLESFSCDTDRMNVIEIEFTAGWEAPGDIPADLREAVILRAHESYLSPGNEEQNFGVSIKTRTAAIKERNYKVQRY